jgi:hypothetical protein
MKEIEIKRILRNGNFSVRWCDEPGTQIIDVLHDGKEFKAVVNTSDAPILLKEAYRTTAYGLCDNLIINPGEGLICKFGGSEYSWATYAVFDNSNEITGNTVFSVFKRYFNLEKESVFLDDDKSNGFIVTGQVYGFGVLQVALMDGEWRYFTDLPNGVFETLERICTDLGGIQPRRYAEEIDIATLRCE